MSGRKSGKISHESLSVSIPISQLGGDTGKIFKWMQSLIGITEEDLSVFSTQELNRIILGARDREELNKK